MHKHKFVKIAGWILIAIGIAYVFNGSSMMADYGFLEKTIGGIGPLVAGGLFMWLGLSLLRLNIY